MREETDQMGMLLTRMHGRQGCLPNIDRTMQEMLAKARDQVVTNHCIMELYRSAMHLAMSQVD